MKGEERRVIYHRDLAGLECFEAPLDVSDYVRDFVGRCEGTHVDTFALHMTYNLCPSRLKVEEYVSETASPAGLSGDHAVWAPAGGLTAGSWRKLENIRVLRERAIDPTAAVVEAAHKAGIDFFAGIRMNDIHHAQWDWHPRFWVDHPECRLGDHPEYRWPRVGLRAPGGVFRDQVDDRIPAALDYIHEEVREYKRAFIEDAARAYDVEGIELDFTRAPFFFKPSEVEAGRNRMTEFVAAVRQGLNAFGNERGRPVVLEVKVLPTLECCRRIGLDVRRWMADDLADIVTASPLWRPDFGMPVGEFLEAAKGTGCKVFACFEFAEMPALRDAEATARVVRAAALAYWRAGVDGIHLFNTHLFPFYFGQEMPFLNDIGDPEALAPLDKHYMVTKSSNYDDVAWFSYPKQLPIALKETPSGEGQEVRLNVGDDLQGAGRNGTSPQVVLRLRLLNLTSKDKVEFKLNGVKLDEEGCRSTLHPMGESGGVHQYPFLADAYFGVPGPYHWLEFNLERGTWPRPGENVVEAMLRRSNSDVSDDVILSDVEITITYGTRND